MKHRETRELAPEYHVTERQPDDDELHQWVARWSPHLTGRRVLDVGAGEGHVSSAFQRAGFSIEGIELNPELARRASQNGVRVHAGDAVGFVKAHGHEYDAFLMFDFIEHVPFSDAEALFEAMLPDSIVILQTPNTNSIAGHQLYLQVPSHVSPYSPTVLGALLARAGFQVLESGTLCGGLPWKGLRRALTEFVLIKLLGYTTTQMLVEGGNYYVVARKC